MSLDANSLKSWNEAIGASSFSPIQKYCLRLWIGQKEPKKEGSILKKQQALLQYTKSSAFKAFEKEQLASLQTSFSLSSIVQVITETLVCFFINALVRSNYVVNFSVDALVAVIALVLLIRNILIKYKAISAVCLKRDYIALDAAALLLAFLSKLLLPANLDAGLLIFMVSYFVQKRKFENSLKSIRI
jgi:hypothetical protein